MSQINFGALSLSYIKQNVDTAHLHQQAKRLSTFISPVTQTWICAQKAHNFPHLQIKRKSLSFVSRPETLINEPQYELDSLCMCLYNPNELCK